MAYPVFYPPASTTLYIPFATYAGSTGASITLTGLAVTDIEIYKNGSTTQRSSDNGYTLLDTDGIDFDGITGIHGVSIDLSDNTDAGFYAVGSWYTVVVSSITVDSQTVNFIAAVFRIAPAETTAGTPEVKAASLGTTAKSDVNAEVVDALTVDVVADSIPADGNRPTIAQAAYMLVQFMLERSISGTTCTVKKPDGSTSLFTLSLNSASSPTSITRAT